MSKTPIEWTEQTWNPIRGCSRVSPGCVNCYAERMAARFSTGELHSIKGNPLAFNHDGPFAGFAQRNPSGPRWTGKVELIPGMLDIPLRRKKPTTYFVNSMSDLFHEGLPDEAIDRIFAVMALCPQHTFQVLTKRADRMRKYFADLNYRTEVIDIYAELKSGLDRWKTGEEVEAITGCGDDMLPRWPLPLPNVWIGVSVEDQQRADERIPLLLQTPAALRFLSVEPLLGPVDLTEAMGSDVRTRDSDGEQITVEREVDWVIVGGESGPGARPCDLAWIRSIVEQCKAAGVAGFVKQLGSDPRECNANGNCRNVNCTHLDCGYIRLKLRDRKGGEPSEWPEDLRVREMPEIR